MTIKPRSFLTFLSTAALALVAASVAGFAPTTARADDAPEEAGYFVFSYFTGGGEDGLHYAVSRDGYRWKPLNGGKSVLKAPAGRPNGVMRDPSICRAPNGVFYLAWTASWDGKSFGVAASDNLIDWRDAKIVPAFENEPTVRNVWAPEIFFDKPSKTFYILWSSTIPGRFSPEEQGTSEDRYDHRVYFKTTKDFETFSPTKLLFDPGHNTIDAYLSRTDAGKYLLFYKDETLKPEPKKTILVAEADSPTGPFGPEKTISAQNWVEGPSALRVGDSWIVYYDCYAANKYGAVRSTNGVDWEDVADRIEFPKGARHGTAFEVDKATFKKLVKRYGVEE